MILKILLIYMLVYCVPSCFGYIWRDYYGRIPQDAIQAGADVNGQKVFIGQVFIKEPPGVYPTSVQKGKEVYVQIYGVKKAEKFIQILCGDHPKQFHWLPANATNLHVLNTANEFIRGGLESNQWVNIGRVKYEGGISVGKVLSGQLGNAELYFAQNGNEVRSGTYEVLTYSGKDYFKN